MKQIQQYQQQPITPSFNPNELVMVPVSEYLELKQIARSNRFQPLTKTPPVSTQWEPTKWFLIGGSTVFALGMCVISILPDPAPQIVEKPVYIPVPNETPSPAPPPGNNAECLENCRNFSFF